MISRCATPGPRLKSFHGMGNRQRCYVIYVYTCVKRGMQSRNIFGQLRFRLQLPERKPASALSKIPPSVIQAPAPSTAPFQNPFREEILLSPGTNPRVGKHPDLGCDSRKLSPPPAPFQLPENVPAPLAHASALHPELHLLHIQFLTAFFITSLIKMKLV